MQTHSSIQAAAAVELLRFDSVRSNPGSMQGVIAMLETQLASRWEQELTTQLTAALRAKQNCTAEARAYRLHRASVRLRAQLMALQNQRTSLLPPVTPEERYVAQLEQLCRTVPFTIQAPTCKMATCPPVSLSGCGRLNNRDAFWRRNPVPGYPRGTPASPPTHQKPTACIRQQHVSCTTAPATRHRNIAAAIVRTYRCAHLC